MPVTVIVGGQFGSEGKGKVAAIAAREQRASAVVRVGGPNSGHTPDLPGRRPLQHLPTASYLPDVVSVLPPGSYIDPGILLNEVELTALSPSRLRIDPAASIVTEADRHAEAEANITGRIGSTGSGTGAAVWRRIMRTGEATLASEVPELRPFLAQTAGYLRGLLDEGKRVVVEGTQGFGLSILHGGRYPFATSRDTTAAGALSETGLSPLDVDDVILVIRAFPIRVAGASGPLPKEINWDAITRQGRHDHDLLERTTVTRRVRRVGRFDADVVLEALAANCPTTLVMNHLDYVDHASCRTGVPTPAIGDFLDEVERAIGRRIDRLGLSPVALLDRRAADLATAAEATSSAPCDHHDLDPTTPGALAIGTHRR